MLLRNAGILIISLTVLLSGCATSGGRTPEQKRQEVLQMKNQTLADLYRLKPGSKSLIQNAPGYAVFSNLNVNIIFASFAGGYGVVKDNTTGRHTYMKMGEAGIGLGLGAKDFRAVFVFHDRKTMYRFIDSGWEFGGHADAAAKADEKGAAIGGEAVIDNITVYQLTKTGLALQATVKGTKYWKDDELN